MRKILILLLLLAVSLSAGCPARKPAPEQAPDPKPLVVPETSKVGFSPVDLNKAPDVVKNIASEISKRETATWVQVNGTNYVLVSVGEKAAGSRAEVTDVTQRVPAQDFVWIDVKARYVEAKEGGDKGGPVTAITLNLTGRTINGVGFEIAREAAAKEAQPAPAAPAPKQTPAPAPKPAPAPTPTPRPAPAPEQRRAAPETPAKQEQTPPAAAPERTLRP